MDGKKKKNRKKKGNQNKAVEDAASNAEEVVVQEQDHDTAPEQNHKDLRSLVNHADAQSVSVSESDVELERHKIYEAKFIMLHEKIRSIEEEKNLWMQREAILEEKLRHLQNEVQTCISNEEAVLLTELLQAGLHKTLIDLQSSNNSLIQKEAILLDKISHIEAFKDAWHVKEISIKEMIDKLDEVNKGLQAQVKELEESRSSFIRENQQLTESMSSLGMRIQHLEKEASAEPVAQKLTKLAEENQVHQTEAACSPVESHNTENVRLSDKGKEQDSAHDQHADVVEGSSREIDHMASPVMYTIPTDPGAKYEDKLFESPEAIGLAAKYPEIYSINNGVVHIGATAGHLAGRNPELDESRRSDEIVQIPLDDTPVHRRENQPVNEDNAGVPFSDAPLTGAPLRLISFMAKYVAGADLVSKNNSRRGR